MLSMTTDFQEDVGSPFPHLAAIAEAGFSHVHWCHHWNTDFLYRAPEVEAIGSGLRDLGLLVTDIHGSAGREKAWCSTVGYERRAGVDLVANRVEMALALGCDAIVMHLPSLSAEVEGEAWQAVFRSMDDLSGICGRHGVRLALENGDSHASFDAISVVLDRYSPSYAGLCYDSGHGNMFDGGLARLERLAGRLIALHLHDNDGSGDQHRTPFEGTVDWARLASVIARSAYGKWVNLEVSMRNSAEKEPMAFLTNAHEVGTRIARMIEVSRPG